MATHAVRARGCLVMTWLAAYVEMLRDAGWEITSNIGGHNNESAAPGIRRIRVPGGWLYQVEHMRDEAHGCVFWHPPNFVAEFDAKEIAPMIEKVMSEIKKHD